MKEKFKNIIITILTWEARAVLARHKPMIVAVTGSLGKTGTKDAVAAALGAQYSVRKSPKSFNSEFGIPLTILGLPNAWNNPLKWLVNIVRGFFKIFIGKYEEVLVLEVGADKPGDIASVAKWLKADVVIITAVPEVPVHMEFYPTIRSVLKEKSELVNSLKDGKVLLTGTDDNVSSIGNPYGEVVRVCYESAQVIYEDGIPRGMHFNIAGYGLDALGVLGEHQGYALAFALAAADAFSVNIPKAIIKLEQMTRTAGRMRLIDGQNGSVIIDDSYNSSPEALKAALITLGSLEASGKKIAVLGDMLELGSHSDREHRRAGLQVAHIVDELYTLGAHAEILANSAIDEGLEERKVHMNNISDAIDVGKGIAEKLNTGDVVLIKASQGKIRLEKVVKEIMLDDTKAGELLVRQGDGWN